MSTESGNTTRISRAIKAKPMSSRFRLLVIAVSMVVSPSDLEDEETLGTQHQDADHDKQREHLGHRAGKEEFERRLRLRDRERRRDGADEALCAAEHHDQKC